MMMPPPRRGFMRAFFYCFCAAFCKKEKKYENELPRLLPPPSNEGLP